MKDIMTEKEADFSEETPISFILINEEGNIEVCFKEGVYKQIDGQYIELNYHADFLYYYIKKNKLAPDEIIDKIREEQNLMKFSKILTDKKYVVILNLDILVYTFFSIPGDTLILTNKNITLEQLKAIKKVKNHLKNIKLSTLENDDDEEIEVKYEELIDNLERKIGGKAK